MHTEQQPSPSLSFIDDLRSHEPRSGVTEDGSRIPITNIPGPACGTCRTKKTKCNREEPSCSECRRRSSICVYGPKDGSGVPITYKQEPACRSCRTLKVKCDREKPECTRCTHNRRTCAYDPEKFSGRHGKQGSQQSACKSCRTKRIKCGPTTPGCTATAEDEVYSSRIGSSGSEVPSDNLTINTAVEAATVGQQALTSGNTNAQTMMTAYQPTTVNEFAEWYPQMDDREYDIEWVDDDELFGGHV
jgi:hypothetical protein